MSESINIVNRYLIFEPEESYSAQIHGNIRDEDCVGLLLEVISAVSNVICAIRILLPY
jgi:hypothetical protein